MSAVQLADCIDISDKVVLAAYSSRELHLQVTTRVKDANAVVMNEALEKLNSLAQHVLPAVVPGIFKVSFVIATPVLE